MCGGRSVNGGEPHDAAAGRTGRGGVPGAAPNSLQLPVAEVPSPNPSDDRSTIPPDIYTSLSPRGGVTLDTFSLAPLGQHRPAFELPPRDNYKTELLANQAWMRKSPLSFSGKPTRTAVLVQREVRLYLLQLTYDFRWCDPRHFLPTPSGIRAPATRQLQNRTASRPRVDAQVRSLLFERPTRTAVLAQLEVRLYLLQLPHYFWWATFG